MKSQFRPITRLLRGGAGGEGRRHIVERANRLGEDREVGAARVVAGRGESGVDWAVAAVASASWGWRHVLTQGAVNKT
jgi:hypothetical protein